jgi:hypothetical protein
MQQGIPGHLLYTLAQLELILVKFAFLLEELAAQLVLYLLRQVLAMIMELL